jgi:hypothetical protein
MKKHIASGDRRMFAGRFVLVFEWLGIGIVVVSLIWVTVILLHLMVEEWHR